MKTLLVLACLLIPVAAFAFVCPDPTTLPFDTDAPLGICADCSNALGAIAWCPVTELSNGMLGCQCLSASIYARCQDPNVALCGPVSACPALDHCTQYTMTHCLVAGTNIPSYVGSCYFDGTSIPNPATCTCWTSLVRQPLPASVKASYASYAGMWSLCALAFQVLSAQQYPPFTWITTRTIAQACMTTASAMTIMAMDPPNASYTQQAPVVLQTIPTFTPADGCALATCNKVNTFLAKLNQVQAKANAAAESMNRASGAMADDAGDWVDQQYEWAAQFVTGMQTAAGLAATALSNLAANNMWDATASNPDLHPAVADLIDDLDALATTDLAVR